jgi:uncharacterized protein (DUF1697 family)
MARSTTTVIVLLRGINVGGKNKLPMADLRAAAESAGYADPTTYLQSGNLVVRGVAASKVGRVAGEIHDAIAASTGLDVPIITRTVEEWRAIIEANPFPDAAADGTKLHLVVLDGKATAAVRNFEAAKFDPEAIAVSDREVYLSLPGGLGRSKLAAAAMRLDNAKSGTARNWKTVLALAEMASD